MVDFEAGTWPVDYTLSNCTVFEPLEMADLKDECELVAVNVLWNFTRRVFGTREVVLRPVPRRHLVQPPTWRGRDVSGPAYSYPNWSFWQPIMIDGSWYNLRTAPGDSPRAPWSLELPGPVVSVSGVRIGSTVLDPAEYRLEGNYLIRREGSWPSYQDIRADIGQEGAWAVTYVRGTPVPRAGQLAAGQLACELGKAALGRTCALPERVQTITRQQVSMTIIDTFEDLEKGRVGMPRVDLWIASVNKERFAATLARSVDVPRSAPVRFS